MTPSEEHLAFYSEIGLTVSQWGHVEYNVFRVLGAFISAADRRMLFKGFFAIENFRTKLLFADSLAKEKLGEASIFMPEWIALHNRIAAGQTKRNKLVHHQVMGYPTAPEGRKYALIPWVAKETKFKSKPSKVLPPPGALCVRDIISYRYEFFRLALDLQNFEAVASGKPKPFPIGSVQATHPPTIRQIENQIHVMLGYPPRPSRR